MSDLAADWFTLIGLTLTVIGAIVAARAVILRPEDAVRVGVPRIVSKDFEGQLKNPMVQNLLSASKWAKRGLIAIALGTVFQMVPIGFRILSGLAI